MTTTFSEPFLRLTERHAAWGAEQLETFNEFLPTGEWSADLGQCLYRQSGRELRISLLGTFEVNECSWLWAWANPGFASSPVAAAAERVRAYGQAHGLPEFTGELVRLDGHPDPRTAAETLAFTAMGVLGAAGYIGVQASPDARAYMVPDDPQVPRAEPDAITLPRVLLTGVSLLGGSGRAAVEGYVAHHDLPRRAAADRLSAGLPDGGTVDVVFDEHDRIAYVHVNTGAPAAS
ncbi:DUF6882 domain-containing protein [Streptomyces sp. t39]|uniref:DUF6882 domain-containing protein n=1 Tax=Streptomyces sp. t39 TaxID=1828156 RepID=UPI0011CDCA40|nr:DUF6882 domain-containing protein [Streptomyces sp. t39]TXS56531.1 hypothetical protein EAO77_10705 [Streptomyces sp. t39]